MAGKEDSKTNPFNAVSGLWTGRGKVAYTGRIREDVSIPKGAKLLVFRNPNATPENRQPAFNLCWVVEENEQ